MLAYVTGLPRSEHAGDHSSKLPSGTLRLLAILTTTNLAFWVLWPVGIVAVEIRGWGPAITGLFGSTAWLACVGGLLFAPRLIRSRGTRGTTLLAATLMFVAAVGTTMAFSGVLAWLWTLMLGFALGLRWTAVDAWLADATLPGAKGRVLSLSETVAGATLMLGPAIAVTLGSAPAVGLAATLFAGVGLLLTRAARAPVLDRPSLLVGAPYRFTPPSLVTSVVLAAALWGGLFESGFSATASLLALDGGGAGGERRALWAAAATGAGSFFAQYGWGVLSDRWGGRVVLLGLSMALAASLCLLAVAPWALVPLSALIGATGGGLYTVAVVLAVQARTDEGSSARAISIAALFYTFGTLAAPTTSGTLIEAFGTSSLLVVMAVTSTTLVAGSFIARR